MSDMALVIVVGLVGGVAVGLQSPIAGAMSQRIGGTASSVVIHASGLVFSLALLALRGGEQIRDWTKLPWYMLGAGIFGLVLYLTISVTLPRLGATSMIVLIITGQLLTGVVLDQFGLLGVAPRQIDPARAAGIAVLLLGSYLVIQ